MLTKSIRNKTKYFVPLCHKLYNQVIDNLSFGYLSTQQFGYRVRNYYEFLDCQRKGGKCVFLTFTYNDKSLPYFCGIPTVDNDNLHYLFRNSGLVKECKKMKFTFKYFITTEFGEGKGIRGYGNNPHYHGLFYLYPTDGLPLGEYQVNYFINRCRMKWQGCELQASSTNDPRNFKFGKVDISKHGKEVNSFTCASYVTKYTIKDTEVRSKVKTIYSALFQDALQYFYQIDNKTHLIVDTYLSRNCLNSLFSYSCEALYTSDVKFREYLDFFIHKYIDNVSFPKIKNRYLPKVFMSKGFGSYALSCVTDDYKIKMPSKKGFKLYNLPFYIYRKLFYDTSVCPHTGSVLYRLNEVGKRYKINSLNDNYDKLYSKVKLALETLDTHIPFNIYDLISDTSIYKYCIYKLCYECRLYDKRDNNTPISLYSDFRYFLDSQDFEHYQGDCTLSIPSHYILYKYHPYFFEYTPLFDYIDNYFASLNKIIDHNQYHKHLTDKQVYSFHKCQFNG